MWTEEKLNELLTTPSDKLVADIAKIKGDIMILGAGGKMGPTLCLLAKKAIEKAGIEKRVIAVSRFTDKFATELLHNNNIETISCDLLDKEKLYALLDYFRGLENERGLLCHLKGWVFVEWSRCNSLTQDINYPTNMLYCAFKEALCDLYGDESLRDEASKLKKVIRDEARIGMFFCDNAVKGDDGSYSLSGELTETCQYYAFFFDIATPESHPNLWKTLVNDFGYKRVESGLYPEIWPANSFIGNYLRLDLLKRYGLDRELYDNIKGYFSYMAETTGTLWEHTATSASCNHGFASHVIYWMKYLGLIK